MADRAEADEGAADAARAFEELRAEVAGLRQAVAALPGAWEEHRPPDTTPTLGAIVKSLAVVAGRLDRLEQQQQVPIQAEAGPMQETARKLELAVHDLRDERQRLAGLVGSARQQDEQRAGLASVGLAALVVGLLASPLVASTLPFGLDGRVAALVMREDRWDAGMALMAAASPEAWREVATATHLARANSAALGTCGAAAAKAQKDQRCTITVPAP